MSAKQKKREREAEVLRKKHERQLRTLQPIREEDDLETYIKGLEHTLIQCQVDEEEWLFYLTANMTGKYATLIQGLSVAVEENYVSVKNHLMEAAGLTARDAGIQLFQLEGTALVGRTALEIYQLITRLISRLFKGAVTMQEFIFAVAMPVFRKLLPKDGMAFLDQKGPKSMEELLDTLQQWWAIARGRPSADVSKPMTVPSRFAHTHCFSCGKMW